MRNSFIFYKSFADSAKELTAKERTVFYEALINYALYDEQPENIKGMPKALFVIAKESIDSNTRKYENGKKGGRPKKETTGFENKKPPVLKSDVKNENQSFSKIKSTETDTETDTVTDTETDTVIYCSEQTSDEFSSEPAANVEAIPLNDGSEWIPTLDQFNEFVRLYPAVDIRQEFSNMRGWSNSNPRKKKTRTGVMRFVNTWLSREQNKNHAEIPKSGQKGFDVF